MLGCWFGFMLARGGSCCRGIMVPLFESIIIVSDVLCFRFGWRLSDYSVVSGSFYYWKLPGVYFVCLAVIFGSVPMGGDG